MRENMKKPTLFVPIIAAVLLIATAVLFFPRAAPPAPAYTPPAPEPPAPQPSSAELYLDALNQSLMSNSIAACEALTDANDKGNCKDLFYQRQAMENNDLAMCSAISFSDARAACTNAVNTRIALYTGDPAACDKITDKNAKRDCLDNTYIVNAANTLNAGLCAKVSTKERQSLCMQRVNDAVEEAKVPYDIRYPSQETIDKILEDINNQNHNLSPLEGEVLSNNSEDE
jgi:hypothetical protein